MRKKNIEAVTGNRLKVYIIFWVFLTVVFSTAIFIQVRKESALSAEIEVLTRRRDDAYAERKRLQRELDLKTSDRVIEAYAHDQLGLVYPNEIIIYDDNYKSDK